MQFLCILSSIPSRHNQNYCVDIKVRVLVIIIEYFLLAQNLTLAVDCVWKAN